MGLKGFQIILENNVYYAGQNLRGKLLVELNKPKRIKGLYLKYFGKGTVQWSEGWRTTTVSHSNTEIYLTLSQRVFGNGIEEYVLQEGRHVFEFNCQLPIELPSSFEGLFGRIKYSVRAVIDQPWKQDYVAKQSFTIMSIFDLNNCPFAAVPIEENNSKIFWGQTKPLFMSIHSPIRGFIPGQNIPLRVIINNESDVHVKSISATLKQNIIFHAGVKSSPTKVFVLRNETPIKEGLGRNDITLNMQTDALPSSYLQFCKIIDVRYQLNVKAKVSGYHKSLKISTEIIIGDIPLVGYEIPTLSLPSNLRIRSLGQISQYSYEPPPYTVVFPPSRLSEDLPPPSYDQLIGIDGNTLEDSRRQEARESPPLYPLHKFGTRAT